MSDGNPTVPERLSALEAKTDRVLEEISGLRSGLAEFGRTVGKHETSIERHETELRIVRLVGLWVFAPLFGAVGLGAVFAIFFTLLR
jgi:hypothetical protein